MVRDSRKRNNDGPVPAEDAPADGYELGAEDDHSHADQRADDEREPEPLEDLRHLEPEVGPLDLLARRAPGHVVRERVREEGLGDGDREPAEEEEAGGVHGGELASERNREKGKKERQEKSTLISGVN